MRTPPGDPQQQGGKICKGLLLPTARGWRGGGKAVRAQMKLVQSRGRSWQRGLEHPCLPAPPALRSGRKRGAAAPAGAWPAAPRAGLGSDLGHRRTTPPGKPRRPHLTFVPVSQLLGYLGVVRASHHADLHPLPQLPQERVHLRRDFLEGKQRVRPQPAPSFSPRLPPPAKLRAPRALLPAEPASGSRPHRRGTAPGPALPPPPSPPPSRPLRAGGGTAPGRRWRPRRPPGNQRAARGGGPGGPLRRAPMCSKAPSMMP